MHIYTSCNIRMQAHSSNVTFSNVCMCSCMHAIIRLVFSTHLRMHLVSLARDPCVRLKHQSRGRRRRTST